MFGLFITMPTKGMRPDRPADKLTANKYGNVGKGRSRPWSKSNGWWRKSGQKAE
jgi:hypothetical protein